MPETMRAIRLIGPVAPDALIVTEVPIPDVGPGWVRIRIMAFGVNESEITSRRGGSSSDFTFPRILGIEAVGVVDATGDGVDLTPGQKVFTMMGGLGRSIDGAYAEYTVVDAQNVIPFTSDLPWDTLGALPEMLQTAHGSLTTGLQLQARQRILIHGGTSSVGLTAIAVAHHLGAIVIATTRNPARFDLLTQIGADYVVLDDVDLVEKVGEAAPEGLHAVLELVGAPALPTMLSLVLSGGAVCFTGALSDEWTIPRFSPFVIPNGVRLTSYGGGATDLPAASLQHYLDAIEAGTIKTVISKVHSGLDEIETAHCALEGNTSPGKHVVLLATA